MQQIIQQIEDIVGKQYVILRRNSRRQDVFVRRYEDDDSMRLSAVIVDGNAYFEKYPSNYGENLFGFPSLADAKADAQQKIESAVLDILCSYKLDSRGREEEARRIRLSGEEPSFLEFKSFLRKHPLNEDVLLDVLSGALQPKDVALSFRRKSDWIALVEAWRKMAADVRLAEQIQLSSEEEAACRVRDAVARASASGAKTMTMRMSLLADDLKAGINLASPLVGTVFLDKAPLVAPSGLFSVRAAAVKLRGDGLPKFASDVFHSEGIAATRIMEMKHGREVFFSSCGNCL